MSKRGMYLTLATTAGIAAFSGAAHRVNIEVTAKYAETVQQPGYVLALQQTFAIPRKLIASVLPPVAAPAPAPTPAAAPKPIKIYPDTPPLQLARSYVETDTSRYNQHIRQAAKATKVPAALIRAVITAESAFNPYALSATGAVGLMQLMPDTAARYGVKNRMDPSQNILGGAKYLSDLLKLFNNNVPLTVAAYNAGEGAVLKHGRKIPPYAETVAYVPKVIKYYKHYKHTRFA